MHGCTPIVPCEGGMYLILQGTVQEISKDEQAGTYKTRNVSIGVSSY